MNCADVGIGTQHDVGSVGKCYVKLSLLILDDEAGVRGGVLWRGERTIEGDVALTRADTRSIDEPGIGDGDVATIAANIENTVQTVDIDIANR